MQRGAIQKLRKAANTMAHAIRLGKVPGARELERGECDTKDCRVVGRRFNKGWWDPNPSMSHCGFVRNNGKGFCVSCFSRQLGVIK